MTDVNFHWTHDAMTPRLLAAVGQVVVYWAMIDARITEMCGIFWHKEHPGQGIPRAFNAWTKQLKAYAAKLYADEPGEFRIFAWYIERLRAHNKKRNDLAHGTPGRVTRDGKQFDGLMVPFPSRGTKFVSMTVNDIEQLGQELIQFNGETCFVSGALVMAHNVASPDIQVWQGPDASILVTKEHRSPKLPRWHPPPPTFQP